MLVCTRVPNLDVAYKCFPMSPGVKPHRSYNARSRSVPAFQDIFPASLQMDIHFPLSRVACTSIIDAKKAGECVLLLGSLTYATTKLMNRRMDRSTADAWLSTGSLAAALRTALSCTQSAHEIELFLLIIASFIYSISSHTSFYLISASPETCSIKSPTPPCREGSRTSAIPGTFPSQKEPFGYLWMSVPKNYRCVTGTHALRRYKSDPVCQRVPG